MDPYLREKLREAITDPLEYAAFWNDGQNVEQTTAKILAAIEKVLEEHQA